MSKPNLVQYTFPSGCGGISGTTIEAEQRGPFVIHSSKVASNGSGYQLTHAQSGLMVAAGFRKRQAQLIAAALEPLLDWDMPSWKEGCAKLAASPDYVKRYVEAVRHDR